MEKKNIVYACLPFLIIGIISALMVVFWFKDGLILGTAEAEIPFYKLERFKDKTAWSWTDFHLGNATGITIASAPSWWLLAKLQNIGIPGFLVQALTFWFLFTSAGIGIYLLTKMLFPQLGEKYLILAVLFYWFNPLSLVNVWNRFLYNYMFFFAALPLTVFCFIWGLQKKNYIFSLVTALILGIFSYALTAYVFNLLTWFLLVFSWVFLVVTNLRKDFILFSLKFNLLTLLAFLFIHAWWLISTFQTVFSKNAAKELTFFVTSEGNLNTLNILSQKLGHLIDITRLMHIAFFQNEGPRWAKIYNWPISSILLFSITGLILWGIYQLRKKKEVLYLGLLFLLGIFFAKGNNQPFGGVFQFFFERIPLLQVFRNPFEKFGFIIAIAAAPLLAVALAEIGKKLKKTISFIYYLVFLILITSVLGFPFLSGLVFTSKFPPNDDYSVGYKVKVPPYYEEANKWLEFQGRNFRFISFPLGDEGMTYKWEKGYQGVEPSGILFSTPNISFNTTIPYYYQIVENLERLLFKGSDFSKIANLLNVRYLMVRSDVDIRERRLLDPKSIEAVFAQKEQDGEVKKIAQFGKLTFWENLRWRDKTVYAATHLISSFPQSRISDVLFTRVGDNDVLLGPVSDESIKRKEKLAIIYPEENVSDKKKQKSYSGGETFEILKKYTVNIDKESEYAFLLDNINFSSDSEASLAAQLKIKVDNEPIRSNGQLSLYNKISYGQINLSAGIHEISIERPMSQNLISALESVSVGTIHGSNQTSFEIKNFDPYSRYLVGFDYFIKSGQEFIFMFQHSNDLQRNGDIIPQYPYFNVLTQGGLNSFRHASGIYTPQRSERASLLFWADPSKNTEVILKNISVNRLIEPQPVLLKVNSIPKITSPPQITYVKHNPTKYSVQVKKATEPFILVLSQLFNSGWEARFDHNTILENHFLANAYANGWLIEKTGDFNLTLEFTPQRLLNIGKVISMLSFLGGLMYIGIYILYKRKSKLWK